MCYRLLVAAAYWVAFRRFLGHEDDYLHPFCKCDDVCEVVCFVQI